MQTDETGYTPKEQVLLALAAALLAVFITKAVTWTLILKRQPFQSIIQQLQMTQRRQEEIIILQTSRAKSSITDRRKFKKEFQGNLSEMKALKNEALKLKAPCAVISGILMVLIGYAVKSVSTEPYLVLPLQDDKPDVETIWIYFLCFVVFNKISSLLMGTRIRGVYYNTESFLCGKSMQRVSVLNFVGYLIKELFLLKYFYTYLKKYKSARYFVSLSRWQSRITGYMCKMYIPICFRAPIYSLFSCLYGVKIAEAQRPYRAYRNFTDFFTRTLKPEARRIHLPTDPTSLCSPCDGTVLTIGQVNSTESTIDCVKGRSYRLDEFMLGLMGDEQTHQDIAKVGQTRIDTHTGISKLLSSIEKRGNQLQYMVIYLSPGDYHRFHSPAVFQADYRRHIVGYLEPVKPSYVQHHKDVFKHNERVNIFGSWQASEQFFFMSFVGALNVGSIVLDFDSDVVTNWSINPSPYMYDKSYSGKPLLGGRSQLMSKKEGKPIELAKGEMIGRFEMGSTIVLIWESDSRAVIKVAEGQTVKLGQDLVSAPN